MPSKVFDVPTQTFVQIATCEITCHLVPKTVYQGFVSYFEQVVFGKASQRMSQPHHPAAPFLHQDFRHWDRMRHARDLSAETSGKKGCRNRSREGQPSHIASAWTSVKGEQERRVVREEEKSHPLQF